MGNKEKGSNAERELIHAFWATGRWTACRVAGSGSMKYPAPDIIAHNNGVCLAIECKSTCAKSKYVEKRKIEELISFAKAAGARPLLAVRFSRQDWCFFDAVELKNTENFFVITRKDSELAITFEELVSSVNNSQV